MRHSPLLSLTAALLLVALSGCDGGDLASSGGDAPTHATTFSSSAIAGAQVQVDGTVETHDGGGTVTLDADEALSKDGRRSASARALKALPGTITFTDRTMTYRTSSGETRTIQLSDRDAAMLQDALTVRENARLDDGRLGETRDDRSGRFSDATVQSLRDRGFEVEALGEARYRVTQPHPRGGANVQAVYDADTGTFESTTARFRGEAVTSVGEVERKDGTTVPRVQRLNDE